MSTTRFKPQRAVTGRQKQVYEFLKDKIRNRGYGPTIREIAEHLGVRSSNSVVCHLTALERKGLITRESHISRAIQLSERPRPRTSLRLAGQIAAGSAVLAVEESDQVDFALLFGHDDHYCLRVKGDSMLEDQIASGDYVVVRRQNTCREGEIVVALVDGHETTLKRFYPESNRIRLGATNPTVKPRYPNNVKVLGVVVGVVRQY
jgi:repressor LexA